MSQMVRYWCETQTRAWQQNAKKACDCIHACFPTILITRKSLLQKTKFTVMSLWACWEMDDKANMIIEFETIVQIMLLVVKASTALQENEILLWAQHQLDWTSRSLYEVYFPNRPLPLLTSPGQDVQVQSLDTKVSRQFMTGPSFSLGSTSVCV
jgi:hypothetical protein